MSNLKINMNNADDVLESLSSKTLRVCVIGIGRIGLPTALSFAKSGLQTIGVDINEKLVENINSGKFPLKWSVSTITRSMVHGETSFKINQTTKEQASNPQLISLMV